MMQFKAIDAAIIVTIVSIFLVRRLGPVGDGGSMEFEVVAEGLRFPEGPVPLDDGSVIIVEIGDKTVGRHHLFDKRLPYCRLA